jgi:hypothetical protein
MRWWAGSFFGIGAVVAVCGVVPAGIALAGKTTRG